ncbi:MAG TPA: hypothetical protein VFF30_10590 [Nitrososphaerales archaeon]|nr:hypothetical protein [Nitrososphaerales archaeon]
MTNKLRRLTLVLGIIVVLLGAYTLLYSPFSIVGRPSQSKTTSISYNAQIQRQEFVTEYSLPPNSEPNVVGVGSDGTVWSVLQNSSALVELDPSSGAVHQYILPFSSKVGLQTWGIAVDSSRNLVWFTDQTSNSVWNFNITSHTFARYSLPAKNSFPFDIAVDSKGDAWFTEYFGGKLGEITSTGRLAEWNVSSDAYSEPAGITIDNQRNVVWFTLLQGNSVCSFSNGRIQLYNLSGYGVSYVTGIAVDSGGNLWLTQHGPSLISEYNPTTHYFRSISTSIPPLNTSLPYFVAVDQSNRVWFDEHYGNSIAVFNPQDSSLVEYLIPPGPDAFANLTGAVQIGLGPDGRAWFPELYTGRIGSVNSSEDLSYNLTFQNSSIPQSPIVSNDGSTVTLNFSIAGKCNCGISLNAYMSNSTGKFSFSFGRDSGIGNFSSTFTIRNTGAERGVYFVTVSAKSASITVSRVLEIQSN